MSNPSVETVDALSFHCTATIVKSGIISGMMNIYRNIPEKKNIFM